MVSQLSLKTTFDCALKRALLANRFLLVSLFDDNSVQCIRQKRDVWSNDAVF